MSYYANYMRWYPELTEQEIIRCVDNADYSIEMSTDGYISPSARQEMRKKYLEEARKNKLGAK